MSIHDISFASHKLFEIGGISITNTFLFTIIVSVLVLFLLILGVRKRKLVPTGFQNLVEWGLETMLNYTDSITGDRKKTKEIFPIASTLFFLIIFANLLEILPGLGVFHFLRSPSSNLNFTLALAITSMLMVHILAIRRIGVLGHFKKFVSKNPIFAFVGALEGLSELTKVFSLAVRLFGNLFAGEVLLIVASFLFSFLLPLPFLLLEILVSFIQALIFSSLIIIFYVTSIQTGES